MRCCQTGCHWRAMTMVQAGSATSTYRLVGVHGTHDAVACFLRQRLPQQTVDRVHDRVYSNRYEATSIGLAIQLAMSGYVVCTSWSSTVWRWSSGHHTLTMAC